MTFLEVKVDGGINEIEVGYDAIRNPGEKHQVAQSVRVKPSRYKDKRHQLAVICKSRKREEMVLPLTMECNRSG